MMADFMRKSINAKKMESDRRKSVLTAGGDDKKGALRRGSILSEQNTGISRRKGLIAGGLGNKNGDVKSSQELNQLE